MWNSPRAKGAGLPHPRLRGCLWRVDFPTNGSYSMFRRLFLPPRHYYCDTQWQYATGLGNEVSASKGSLARACPWMSRDIQGLPCVCSTSDMPLSIPTTTVSLRWLSKNVGEVELWARWSFQTSPLASLEFLLTILDSILTAAACHWTTREPQRSKTRLGEGAARASGGFAESA
jgi:hypothetical protein